ncbi:MAG: 2OG-Fe(II) oxygenase [Dokdonella sp.]|nr:2OG-Fe(II) oxygenase [Dokdonella sp.]
MGLIDSRVLSQASDYAREFAQARPFRHLSIPDFFDPALSERLLADFPSFEARHALNEMGEVGGKAVRMDVRDISDAYRELDRYLQTPEFLGFVSQVTGIPDLLYDPDYVGGGTHENRDGQGLDAHVDFNYHPRTRWHRRLNLIVYLNPRWESGWGGELELHSDPWREAANEAVHVPPLFNRCAIFETTENSWHGFSAITLPDDARHLSRKSFAIYLYTRERPPEQSAPPHATIYVPQGMPPDWREGRTLDAADLRVLNQRFSRLRTQLRYLYDREKHHGAQMATLERALDEARAALRLDLQGYATQPGGASGLWPDGWVGEEFSARFVPTRATKSLRLELWSPPQLGTEQQLQIALGGKGYAQSLRPGMRTPVELPLRARAGEEIELTIRAARCWSPAAGGADGDQRSLAYKILTAALEH